MSTKDFCVQLILELTSQVKDFVVGSVVAIKMLIRSKERRKTFLIHCLTTQNKKRGTNDCKLNIVEHVFVCGSIIRRKSIVLS